MSVSPDPLDYQFLGLPQSDSTDNEMDRLSLYLVIPISRHLTKRRREQCGRASQYEDSRV